MPKDWIDKAAASGDWSIASQKAAAALRHRPREEESEFEEDALPDDEVADDVPVSTRRKAELAIRAEAERQRVLAQQAKRKINIALEAAKHEEALKRQREDSDRRWKEGEWIGHFHLMSEEEMRRLWYRGTSDRRNWAGISQPVGPPPDPPPDYGARIHVIGDRAQWWRYLHRGLLSAVEPGRQFGPSPPGTPPENPYYGYAPKTGRPRNPNKLSAAEKQRAYRQRRKAKEAAK